ncbi:transcriptional regulator, TetR family [Maridesulfovibrio ferrireducens]|uniref:Transcriptional regulator, TetR family n=1 Tax=Maridesulfovibrio ferrireducens TaxID=246191 RepID=A0A1G9CZ26_9BACT|nr:TetR/AcrR family transcriptional regulator [Maridesulfovibrio ferrireducens]SDK56966.1 transcriptional regulator, TetR family [Maridesulfovibrio ferrireducens]
MPRAPVQSRSKEKKRKIIVAGMKLFSDKGFHKTSINEIVENADVSVGSFYGYFKNKKDLLIEVSQAYGNSIIKGIYGNIAEDAPVSKDGHSIIKYIVSSAKQAHTLSTELHREMLALKNREPEMAKLDRRITLSFQEGIETILEKCGNRIKVKDTHTAAKLVAGAIEETMHRCFLENQEENQEQTFNELTEMCAGYLFHPAKQSE